MIVLQTSLEMQKNFEASKRVNQRVLRLLMQGLDTPAPSETSPAPSERNMEEADV